MTCQQFQMVLLLCAEWMGRSQEGDASSLEDIQFLRWSSTSRSVATRSFRAHIHGTLTKSSLLQRADLEWCPVVHVLVFGINILVCLCQFFLNLKFNNFRDYFSIPM